MTALLVGGHAVAATTDAVRADVVDIGDITTLTNEVIPLQLINELEPGVLSMMEEAYLVVGAGLGLTGSFNVVDTRMLGYLTEFSAVRIAEINETTRQAIRRALAEGVLAGEGSAALGLRVRAVFEQASRWRATLIARTETTTAANFARTLAMEQAGPGIVPSRRWLATLDARTRRTHLMLNNQVQPLGRPFVVPGTGSLAMYPGGFSDVKENANCRCVVLPVVNPVPRRDAVGDREAVDKVMAFIDEKVLLMERAVRRAFAAQERLVMARLAFLG